MLELAKHGGDRKSEKASWAAHHFFSITQTRRQFFSIFPLWGLLWGLPKRFSTPGATLWEEADLQKEDNERDGHAEKKAAEVQARVDGARIPDASDEKHQPVARNECGLCQAAVVFGNS